MNSQGMILDMMRAQGKSDALDLRGRAATMDGTGIIAEEAKVPTFDRTKDYSAWPTGSPVSEVVDGEVQVYTLIQPHNAANYPGSAPSNTPALWSITHTKDPARAKPWRAPNGISGLYSKGEVCTDPQAQDPAAIYRSKKDNNEFAPSAYPANWELVKG